MFPGMSPFNQLQPFAQGVGGVNPIVSQLMPPQVSHPLLAAYLTQQHPALASLLTQQGGQGWGGQIAHPLAVAHIAANYPNLLPVLAQQAGYGQVPYGIQSLLQSGQGQMGSPFQQFGGGFGQQINPIATVLSLLGQQGYGQQFGGFGQQVSPLSAILSLAAQQRGFTPQVGPDPFTLMQLSQWSQSQLPIRPLISPQQFDPIQAACQAASLSSTIGGPTVDPYTALAQACLTSPAACLPSPLAVSSVYPAVRPQVVAPWAVSAGISPLASQIVPPVTPQITPITPITPMMQSVAQPCI